MPNKGPIIIVEDDEDDLELMQKIIHEFGVKNTVKHFRNGKEALEYLKKTTDKPFFILCDINMPIMNGIQLRASINKDEYLRKKSIPFIFLSTSANKEIVDQAFEMTVQGFFKKGQTLKEIELILRHIIDYWTHSKHPNHYL